MALGRHVSCPRYRRRSVARAAMAAADVLRAVHLGNRGSTLVIVATT